MVTAVANRRVLANEVHPRMKFSALWAEQAPMDPDLCEGGLPRKVDVAIIGGGYTGLSAARMLAKSGASVAVLERNSLGWGASSRNGGMTTTGLKLGARTLIKKFGSRLGRELWQSSFDAITAVETVVKEENIDCHFARRGGLQLASKPRHYERMCRDVDWMRRELGHERFLIPQSELKREIGTRSFFGGVYDPLSGGLHPAKYVLGLARAAKRAGALLCENANVLSLSREDGGFLLQLKGGTVSAREILIATNGYTGELNTSVKRRVMPIGSYIIVTEPLSHELRRELSPRQRMFFDSKWFLNYFRLTPDGRMLFGGRASLSTGLDLEESARRLRSAMVEIFPQLESVAVTHSWSGSLGLTFDTLPHLGRVDGIHYALGYSGHGVAVATLLGAQAGELIAGSRRTSPFMEIPHPSHFFYRRNPWFLPVVSVGLRVMDWVS